LNLLIVRLSAFGDIIHALPLAANARRAGATVGWLCEARYRELLEGNPSLDRVFVADTRGWRRRPAEGGTRSAFAELRRELAAFGADFTIDVQGLWKSALLARAARAPVVGFDSSERREGLSALLASRRVRPPDASSHIVDRNLALLSAVGIPVAESAPDARYLLATPSPEADAFLAAVPRPYALYHPGAGWPEKRWDAEKLAAVAHALESRAGLHPVISWGPGDEEVVAAFEAALPGSRRMPPLSPRALAHVAAGAALFLGNDTGPLHLADALGTPTLALFGPTDPARNGPYRGAAIAFRASTSAAEVAAKAAEIVANRAS
jgi:heptosyltransferase-1